MAIIHYFGRFSDIGLDGRVTLPAHVKDTAALATWLSEENDRFAAEWQRPGAQMVLNQEMVRGVQPLSDTDEVAFMSALSGG